MKVFSAFYNIFRGEMFWLVDTEKKIQKTSESKFVT